MFEEFDQHRNEKTKNIRVRDSLRKQPRQISLGYKVQLTHFFIHKCKRQQWINTCLRKAANLTKRLKAESSNTLQGNRDHMKGEGNILPQWNEKNAIEEACSENKRKICLEINTIAKMEN